MKITIIEANDSRQRFDHIVWTIASGCYYIRACASCAFGVSVNTFRGEHACLHYRKQFINTVPKQQFPYTFDTDDYPEVLI